MHRVKVIVTWSDLLHCTARNARCTKFRKFAPSSGLHYRCTRNYRDCPLPYIALISHISCKELCLQNNNFLHFSSRQARCQVIKHFWNVKIFLQKTWHGSLQIDNLSHFPPTHLTKWCSFSFFLSYLTHQNSIACCHLILVTCSEKKGVFTWIFLVSNSKFSGWEIFVRCTTGTHEVRYSQGM